MKIRTTKDIPDEIKNIIELFYIHDENLARAEAQKLRNTKPELAEIVNHVLQLMPNPPQSVYGFYDALISLCANEEFNKPDDDFPLLIDDFMVDDPTNDFDLSGLFDDDKQTDSANPFSHLELGLDSARSFSSRDNKPQGDLKKTQHPSDKHTPVRPVTAVHDLEKEPELRNILEESALPDISFENAVINKTNKKQAQTQLPSILDNDKNESDKKQLGLRGRELSSKPDDVVSDFNLDIDIDFDAIDPDMEVRTIKNDPEPISKTLQRTGQFNAIANPGIIEKATGSKTNPVSAPVPVLASGNNTLSAAKSNSPSIMRASQMAPGFNETSTSQRISNLVHSVEDNILSKAGLSGIRKTSLDPENSQLKVLSASQRIDSARQTVPKTNAAPTKIPDPNAITAPKLKEDSVPRLACNMSDLSKRKDINPKGGFLISLIDGATSVADIIELSMFPKEETLSLLNELVKQQIIQF